MKEINLNEQVKVKFTEYGFSLHRKIFESHYKRFNFPYEKPEVDADGFSKFQLWDLMRQFGPYLYNGCIMPFDAAIWVEE